MGARVNVACKYAAIVAVTATMIHEGDERGRSIDGFALCVAEADLSVGHNCRGRVQLVDIHSRKQRAFT